MERINLGAPFWIERLDEFLWNFHQRCINTWRVQRHFLFFFVAPSFFLLSLKLTIFALFFTRFRFLFWNLAYIIMVLCLKYLPSFIKKYCVFERQSVKMYVVLENHFALTTRFCTHLWVGSEKSRKDFSCRHGT